MSTPEPRLPPVAGARDVIGFYRVFLGRRPESDSVVNDRIGHDFARLVREFTSSEEFRTEIVEPMARGAAWRPSAFEALPDKELLGWLATHFAVDANTLVGATATSAWTSVMLQLAQGEHVANALGQSLASRHAGFVAGLRRVQLTGALGDGLAEAEWRPAARSAADRAEALRTARNTYLLVRGRKLTRAAEALALLNLDAREQLLAHLLCRDFQERVEFPLRATGAPAGERFRFILKPSLRRWAAQALPLTTKGREAIDTAETHAALTAVILSDARLQEELATLIEDPSLAERLNALAALLQSMPHAAVASGLVTEEAAEEIGDGLRLVPLDHPVRASACREGCATQGLRAESDLRRLGQGRDYQVTGPDPAFHLEPSLQTGRWALSLSFNFRDVRAAGGLHALQAFFDTGRGFTEHQSRRRPITCNRGALHAILIQEAEEVRVRIDPCDGGPCIVHVAAARLAEL